MTREPLLTIEEVAEYLRVPVRTLYNWRTRNKGPAAYKVGRELRYSSSDLDAWMESQKTAPVQSDGPELSWSDLADLIAQFSDNPDGPCFVETDMLFSVMRDCLHPEFRSIGTYGYECLNCNVSARVLEILQQRAELACGHVIEDEVGWSYLEKHVNDPEHCWMSFSSAEELRENEEDLRRSAGDLKTDRK